MCSRRDGLDPLLTQSELKCTVKKGAWVLEGGMAVVGRRCLPASDTCLEELKMSGGLGTELQ